MYEPSELSDEAVSVLRNAGWSAGRRVDISAQIAALRARGIVPHPAAEAFLSEFAGLSLEPADGGVSYMDFDIDGALLELSGDDCPTLERVIGETVCPIGYGGRMFAFVTPSARMVFLHDEWLVAVTTDSIKGGIEMICSRDYAGDTVIELASEQRPPLYRDD